MQQSTTMRAALIAGAALVAAGAFATALGEETANRTAPTSLGSGSKMTVGETATTTTAPSAVLTPIAQPVLKATVPCGFSSQC
jgi:hypothetical protein